MDAVSGAEPDQAQPLEAPSRTLPRPVGAYAAMPPRASLEMPEQSLRKTSASPASAGARHEGLGVILSRLFVFGGALLLTAYGASEMYGVINVGAITALKWALLVLFVLNFSWIALAFTNALLGFCILLRGDNKSTAPVTLTQRTAILLPVHNEDPPRPFAALTAMIEDMAQSTQASHFDWYILSDTTHADIWITEEKLYLALLEKIPAGANVYYRRRSLNAGRKAGNVKDFVTGWGADYAHFLVMDADSIMNASTIVQLAAAMEADPNAGIIQTVPTMINRNTLLARMQQFAGRFYGPVLATGLAAWSGRQANFWGHNAILRTEAFAACCGLPVLRGRPPLGGHILSHDFVEAALIVRAGYSVIMLPQLHGTFEESPPSLIDLAIRDRRWCQGNLQHMGVIGARGLTLASRQHLASGIMSYLASPVWLAQLIVGILLVLQSYYIRPEYFTDEFSMLPAFPRFDAERALALLGTTMAVLLAPKVFGIILAIKDSKLRRNSGGALRLIASALIETVYSALIAPIMMVIQTGNVFRILTGVDSGWNPQAREDGSIPFKDIVRKHYQHVLLGLLTLLVALLISPLLAAWMSPTIAGLFLAIALSWLSGQRTAGLWLKKYGLLLIPEEDTPPATALRARALRTEYEATTGLGMDALALIHGDEELRQAHTAMLPDAPHRERGSIGAARAVAITKLNDAACIGDAVRWLNNSERNEVLGDRALTDILSRLPDRPPD